MKETINQKNLYLLLPAKVSRMAEMLADDKGLSMIDALTKAWHRGPTTRYYDMIHENDARSK